MRGNRFALILVAATFPLIMPIAPAIGAAGAPAVMQPGALSWGPAEGLPPGAQVAVLYGDPTKTGPFGVRFKFPAGYEIATHSHPTDEFLTVVSGTGKMAFGEGAKEADAQPLATGTFTSLPAGAWHHLWIETEMVLELHSTGPFAMTMK